MERISCTDTLSRWGLRLDKVIGMKKKRRTAAHLIAEVPVL